MKPARKILVFAGLALIAVSTACRSPELRKGGHLSDYSKLQEIDSNRLVYVNPRVQPGTYNGFIVEEIAVNLAEDRVGAFTPEELEELAEFTYTELTKNIAKYYRVVARPGPGIARVRIALTDIETSKSLLNILPHTRVVGVGRGGAAFEAEVVDSQTGEQLFAVIRRAEPGMLEGSGVGKMSDAKTQMKEWCLGSGKNIEAWRKGEHPDEWD